MRNSKPSRPGRAARAAEVAGRALRLLGKAGPGIGGAGLVCGGLWQVWEPLGLLGAGAFLLMLDRRTP